MSSRFRAASLLLAALALAGCDREQRESRSRPLPEQGPRLVSTSELYAGGPVLMPADPRAGDYEGNAFHINEGKRLFEWFNCSGCHAHGGGDIGPPLMDDQWRYGGKMEQIVATLIQGRPNGMPSFRTKLTEQQMWQLAAYVRSMSGQPPKDAVASRGDEMSSTEPMTLTEEKPETGSDGAAAVQGTSK